MSQPPAGTADGRPSFRPDALDASYAALLAVVAAWSWLAIVLGEAGVFQRQWAVVAGAPSILAGLAVWRGLRPVGRARLSHAFALAAAIAGAAWLSARPAEYLVDGSDGSVYLNIGRAVARHGAFQFPDPVLAAIPPDRWEALIERERHPPRVLNLFPGGIQVSPGVNAVQPNFFPLFPAWVAIAEHAAGPRAGYFVAPAFGLLAMAAFWLLARLLTTALVATAASALLLANFGQQWFSRVPTTEVMTQSLVAAGVLCSAWAYRGAPPVVGGLAGAAFGLAAFARIDVFILVLPVVAGFLLVVRAEGRWGRAWTWHVAALAGVTAHAAAHAWTLSALYTRRIVFYALQGRSVSTASRVVPPLVLATAAAALLAARWLPQRHPAVRRLPWIALGVVGLAAAYRIWPQVVGGPMALLLTPWGLAAGAAGIALWVREQRPAMAVLLAGLLLTSMMVYGESARERADMPMPLRRFVPVVLPLTALAIGSVLHRLWRMRRAWRAAAVMLWASILALWGVQSRPLARSAPMHGLHDQLARLASALPAGAIVVADGSTPSHLALSLWGSFGRDVLFVTPTPGTASALGRLARDTRRPLVIVRGGGETALTAADLADLVLSAPRTETLVLSAPEPATDRLPRAMTSREVALELYAAAPRGAPSVPVDVEIGAGDMAAALDGFHAAEQMGPASARWTTARARLLLPALPPLTGAVLTLRAAAPRPAGRPAPLVRLQVDGIDAGVVEVTEPGFAEIAVAVPPAAVAAMAGAASILTLDVPTFVPSDHGMGDDTRALGIVVDWVRVDGR